MQHSIEIQCQVWVVSVNVTGKSDYFLPLYFTLVAMIEKSILRPSFQAFLDMKTKGHVGCEVRETDQKSQLQKIQRRKLKTLKVYFELGLWSTLEKSYKLKNVLPELNIQDDRLSSRSFEDAWQNLITLLQSLSRFPTAFAYWLKHVEIFYFIEYYVEVSILQTALYCFFFPDMIISRK